MNESTKQKKKRRGNLLRSCKKTFFAPCARPQIFGRGFRVVKNDCGRRDVASLANCNCHLTAARRDGKFLGSRLRLIRKLARLIGGNSSSLGDSKHLIPTRGHAKIASQDCEFLASAQNPFTLQSHKLSTENAAKLSQKLRLGSSSN